MIVVCAGVELELGDGVDVGIDVGVGMGLDVGSDVRVGIGDGIALGPPPPGGDVGFEVGGAPPPPGRGEVTGGAPPPPAPPHAARTDTRIRAQRAPETLRRCITPS